MVQFELVEGYVIQLPAPVGVALKQMGVLVVLRYVYETTDRQHPALVKRKTELAATCLLKAGNVNKKNYGMSNFIS